MKFTDPVIRFTDNTAELTDGSYRDDCGRLATAESEYVQEFTGAVSESPRFATPDVAGKFPTMTELYSNRRPGEILNRPPIDLTGWTGEEVHEPWAFTGVHSDVV